MYGLKPVPFKLTHYPTAWPGSLLRDPGHDVYQKCSVQEDEQIGFHEMLR
jgi:hypothetical protein